MGRKATGPSGIAGLANSKKEIITGLPYQMGMGSPAFLFWEIKNRMLKIFHASNKGKETKWVKIRL